MEEEEDIANNNTDKPARDNDGEEDQKEERCSAKQI